MKDDAESIGLIPDSIKEKVDLSPRCPATWHNPRRDHSESSRQRVLDNLRRDNTTHPQAIKRFLNSLFSRLARYTLPWRNRGQ